MSRQINDPICDYFAKLQFGRTKLTLPVGRLWSFSVNRCGSDIIVVSRYRGEQRSCHKIQLKNGL